MSYSSVSHVGHESYPSPLEPGPVPLEGAYAPPPPPPRPGFEQGYAGIPPHHQPPRGYQGYFREEYPQSVQMTHHGRPFNQPYNNDYSYDSPGSSLLRTCLAAFCCCCVMEECCRCF